MLVSSGWVQQAIHNNCHPQYWRLWGDETLQGNQCFECAAKNKPFKTLDNCLALFISDLTSLIKVFVSQGAGNIFKKLFVFWVMSE